MSVQYYDDIPTIRAKEQKMREKFNEHVQEVLSVCADASKMEHIKRWEGRNAVQWLRRQVVSLCVAARSWAYDDGTEVFGFQASDHAKAMRSALIVEMKIWLAALRKIKTKNEN